MKLIMNNIKNMKTWIKVLILLSIGTILLIGEHNLSSYLGYKLSTLSLDQLLSLGEMLKKSLMIVDLLFIVIGTAITFKDKDKMSKEKFHFYIYIYGFCLIIFICSFCMYFK